MEAEKIAVIETLRRLNYPYSFIAKELGMSLNTVKSICRRNGFKAEGKRKTKNEKETAHICNYCHKPLLDDKRSDSKFCSLNCRIKWRRQNIKIIQKNT